MNIPSTSSRPRLFCRFARLWAHLRSQRQPAHGVACADCREYFAAADDFENRLRRGARALEPAAPSGLEQRIMQSVTPAIRSRRAPAVRSGGWLFACAGLAACAALVFAWVWVDRPDSPPSMAQNEAPAPVVATGGTTTWAALGERLLESVAPATATLTDENPLQQEIDFVYADTRAALRFLARNFLTSVPAALALEDEVQETSS